jgi:hypothetical protein
MLMAVAEYFAPLVQKDALPSSWRTLYEKTEKPPSTPVHLSHDCPDCDGRGCPSWN